APLSAAGVLVAAGPAPAAPPGAGGPQAKPGAGCRHEKGRGGSVARHVSYGSPEATPRKVLAAQEVEVIATHRVAGDHAERHLKARGGGYALGQQASLPVGGHAQSLPQGPVLEGRGLAC